MRSLFRRGFHTAKPVNRQAGGVFGDAAACRAPLRGDAIVGALRQWRLAASHLRWRGPMYRQSARRVLQSAGRIWHGKKIIVVVAGGGAGVSARVVSRK